ncbi:uncharacterized protein LOC143654427 isoform X1 [Tamandua tetradactyla]|uniref:uncharacterized protein LOC143654427 isoform X1 n=1 Tax=Tamandua tetradactyla TaxID=48850 RepID=UPI0040538298
MAATEGTLSQINPTANSTTSRPYPTARRPVIGPEAASCVANGRSPLSGRRRRAAESDVTPVPGPDCEAAARSALRLRPGRVRTTPPGKRRGSDGVDAACELGGAVGNVGRKLLGLLGLAAGSFFLEPHPCPCAVQTDLLHLKVDIQGSRLLGLQELIKTHANGWRHVIA